MADRDSYFTGSKNALLRGFCYFYILRRDTIKTGQRTTNVLQSKDSLSRDEQRKLHRFPNLTTRISLPERNRILRASSSWSNSLPTMNSEHLETTNATSFSIPTMITNFRNVANQHSTTDQNASVTQADLSTPFIASEQEESRLVDQLRQTAIESGNHAVATAHKFYLVACVRARKGNVSRAFALAINYVKWRSSFSQNQLDLANSPKMQEQLASRLLFVSGNVDKHGRPILNLRPRNHNPTQFSASDTLRMLTFVLEWTLRTYPAAQTHGIAIVNDMTAASLKNLDVRIPGVMHNAFANNLPVRLAAINLINSPFVLRAVVGIVTTLLSRKLKTRVRIFGKNDHAALSQLIDQDHIPEDIGMRGTASWTEEKHMEWVQRMTDDCIAWNSIAELDQN